MPSYSWRDRESYGIGSTAIVGSVVAAVALVAVVTWIGRIPWDTEDALEGWVFLSLAFVGGVVAFVYGFTEYKRRSLVANTPTSKVRSLSMGTVELEGRAKPRDEPMEAPISGEDCVLYEYRVEEYRQTGDDADWVTVDSDETREPFDIEDGTASVMVDPKGADLRLPRDERIRADGFDELPETTRRFVRGNEEVEAQDGDWFDNDRRYTEWRIDPDQTVYVFGEAMPRDDGASSVNPENAVVNEDRTTPMFVISDQPESEVLSSMTKRTVGYILGGFAVAVGGFAALVWYLGIL
jgi:hypothetical protein